MRALVAVLVAIILVSPSARAEGLSNQEQVADGVAVA